MRFERVPSSYPDMRLWAASSGNYSFVISEERMVPPDPLWSGFTASWKNVHSDMTPFGKQAANKIDGGPWKTLAQAEQACNATLKQLRRKQ